MQPCETAITQKVANQLLEKITWQKEYNTGFINIDLEHKMLADMVNYCITLTKSNNNNPHEIRTILNKMADYARLHFEHEEKMLLETQYPFLEEHKHEHLQYVCQLNEMIKHYDEGDLTSYELLKFLKDWLLHHILEMDMQYVAFCNR